jgi:3-phosphoshikimate 1-carboxyvinyltransferase
MASLCKGKTVIKPFLRSNDTLATLDCMKRLGISAELRDDNTLIVEGKGMLYLPPVPTVNLYARESGTTMRILSGILAGQKFDVLFDAEPSLARRPMKRIVEPLRKMGANISGSPSASRLAEGSPRRTPRGEPFKDNIFPPLVIRPVKHLKGKTFKLEIASAQVKSAILFASLYADKKTTVIEPFHSRDHTERMLKLFKAKIKIAGRKVTCRPLKKLCTPGKIFIPADFSSAAFLIVLALILKKSAVTIKNVNINPTRCGLLNVLKRMGAKIKIVNKRAAYEPYADIIAEASRLKGATVKREEIPLMIDEIPILCVAAAFAQGITRIEGIKELRIKETDRIASMVSNLRGAGVDIADKPDGKDDWMMIVKGKESYDGAHFVSHHDHRTAMSMIVFAMACGSGSSIDDLSCIDKSFPEFVATVSNLYTLRNPVGVGHARPSKK